ncbi:MFS transporter [Trinickia terrae]|uniref:MFS transporter n=1 Tax=Trinickia terrae TaxID=2571161 RepID=A0A4U1HW27_9BURK|nr:MFS transporter [Trinickia terrae]TKC85909.1 MFS transporter [Trinickia terrae]
MQTNATAGSTSLATPSPGADATLGARISARIDRLPVTRHMWMLVLLISLGGFFEIYDLIFTGYIAPGMVKSGLLQTTTEAFFGMTGIAAFIAATFAGLFAGTFGLGWMPDRYGRRAVFTFSLLWYSVSSAIMALQTTPEGLLLWRFITGIGVGVEIITIDTYVTEIVPQQMRGRAIAFNQTVMFAAAPVAALLSWWLVPQKVFGLDGWRAVVLAGSAGAVVVWFIRRRVPESPRWLADHGRQAESERIVDKMESIIVGQSGSPLAPPEIAGAQPVQHRVSLADLWQAPYRSRLIMLAVFNFFQAIGYHGFVNWVPTLLIAQGITVTKSLLYSFIIAFAMPAGPLLGMLYADRIQRKYLIVGSALAISICGIAFGQMRSTIPLIVCGILISLATQTLSVSCHAYQSELFPTALRGRASGMVYSASRIGAMFSGFLIAALLKGFGVGGVFAGVTAAMIAVAISIGAFGPRTNGVPLEQLNR